MLLSVDMLLRFTWIACVYFFFLMIRRPPRSTPLSLHDALPISAPRAIGWDSRVWSAFSRPAMAADRRRARQEALVRVLDAEDRKSTRLNSSHSQISYAVFCLKKKKTKDVS